jgi:hypothetical protein
MLSPPRLRSPRPLWAAALLATLLLPSVAGADLPYDQESQAAHGVAVTDIYQLRAFERAGLSLNQVLGVQPDKTRLFNEPLFGDPRLKTVVSVLHREWEDFKPLRPRGGVGTKFPTRLFDIDYVTSPFARFVLVGVVNRMDRAYVDPEHCGEIRLIYRLAYQVIAGGEVVASRLPMTINLLFHARNPGDKETCADLAKRWLEAPRVSGYQLPTSKDEQTAVVDRLLNDVEPSFLGPGRVLDLTRLTPAYLKDLEVNMQLNRTPSAVRRDFGADSIYLLKVFRWQGAEQTFAEHTLENEPDLEKIDADPALREELDEGTLLLPDRFLARRAKSTAPAGMKRLVNRPFTGLFTKPELVAMNIDWSQHERMVSASGFLRRMSDLSCTGCHQTRSVAGFHFTGRDPAGRYPGNSVFTSASPHFLGDLPRRRSLLEAMSKGQTPDYARGYAERPDPVPALEGTGLLDGWGAHCGLTKDPTFKRWTCAEGNRCVAVLTSDYDGHVGLCLSPETQAVGEVCELGHVTTAARGDDSYQATRRITLKDKKHYSCAPQSPIGNRPSGGFPSGEVHKHRCTDLGPEATCGVMPSGKPGFNRCVIKGPSFLRCLTDYKADRGLRACDARRTCRDDYVCAEGNLAEEGACVPPCFMFQFRVDGHPIESVVAERRQERLRRQKKRQEKQ